MGGETKTCAYRLLALDVEVTNHCNARCEICPRDAIERPLGMMSADTFRNLLDRVASSAVSAVIFSGFGEPLLHRSLPEFVSELRSGFRGTIQINTNASALVPDLSRRLIDAGLDLLNVSYNGPGPEAYERVMRGMRFERLRENLREFVRIRGGRRRPGLSLQCSMPDARAQIGRIRRIASLLGAESLNLYGYNNRAGNIEGDGAANTVPLEERFCYPLLFVAWDGTVYPCSHDIKGTQPLGAVTDPGFVKLPKEDYPICRGCTIADRSGMRSYPIWKNRLRHAVRRLAG